MQTDKCSLLRNFALISHLIQIKLSDDSCKIILLKKKWLKEKLSKVVLMRIIGTDSNVHNCYLAYNITININVLQLSFSGYWQMETAFLYMMFLKVLLHDKKIGWRGNTHIDAGLEEFHSACRAKLKENYCC